MEGLVGALVGSLVGGLLGGRVGAVGASISAIGKSVAVGNSVAASSTGRLVQRERHSPERRLELYNTKRCSC